jgi:hypothetical protein
MVACQLPKLAGFAEIRHRSCKNRKFRDDESNTYGRIVKENAAPADA